MAIGREILRMFVDKFGEAEGLTSMEGVNKMHTGTTQRGANQTRVVGVWKVGVLNEILTTKRE